MGVLTVLACWVAGICPTEGDESRFSDHIELFMDLLKPLHLSQPTEIFNDYYPIIYREINTENLYVAYPEQIYGLLDKAVSESVDVLTLFTHPAVHREKALLIRKKTLHLIDHYYDLHAIFLLSCPSISEDTMIRMNFLVVGQGKLIIGYDKNTRIKHPDYPFATGRYDYQKFFMMDAGTDDQGNIGLFDIRGLSNSNDRFEPMKGPLNAAVKSLSLIFDSMGNKEILVKYKMFGIGRKVVEPIPIEYTGLDN